MSYLAVTLVISAVAVLLYLKDKSTTSELVNLTEPGYFEQYFQMKKNENNEIPKDAWKSWMRYDQLAKKESSIFSDVRTIGPDNIGGRTRSIVIDQDDPKRLYAGGVSGGFWHSEDGGISWNPASDKLPTMSITSITQNPFNTDEIYYSTGEYYGNSAGIAGSGIFRSTDRGQTFTMLPGSDTSAFTYTWRIAHSLMKDSVVYVGTNSSGFFRTTDAGQTWNKIYGTASPVRDIEVFPDSTVWFSVQGHGIYEYNEKTGKVALLGNGLPTSSLGNIDLDYCGSNPDVVYAVVVTSGQTSSLNGIYKTTDKGGKWTQMTNPRSNFRWNQGSYDLFIEVDYDNPDFLVTGAVDAVYSTDGGSSWTNLAEGHVDYHCCIFWPNSSNFMVGCDGGIYKYNQSTSGTSYIDLNRGYNVTQFYAGYYFPEDNHTIAGAQDNGTWLNRNEATIAQNQLWGDGSYCAVDQQSGMMYGSWQYAQIRRKTSADLGSWVNISNGLRSVTPSSNDFWFINPFELNPVNGQQIYVITKNNIIRSINAGTSWSLATDRITGNAYCAAFTDEDDPYMYVGGQSGVIYRMPNAATAQKVSMDPFFSLSPSEFKGSFVGNIEINPQDNSTIYTALTSYSLNSRIWKINKADSDNPVWVDISSNLPENLPVNWIEVDPNDSNIIMIATDNGLYTSANGGGWWVKDETIPNVTIPMIRLRESDRRLYVFSHGRGIWIADLKDNGDVSGVKEVTQKEFTVFPNPATDHIQFDAGDEFQARIYDLAGRTILSADSESRIDVSSLRTGTYFIEVTDRAGTRIAKFRKL